MMFNAITEYQLHDEGMQKMRPYRKLSLMASHGAPWCCDFEQVPYKTIKKFDVS